MVQWREWCHAYRETRCTWLHAVSSVFFCFFTTAFVFVRVKLTSNSNFHNLDYQIGKYSSVCTVILEKVVNSPNWGVSSLLNTTSIWERVYWKWFSVVQLLPSEGYWIKLVLAGWKHTFETLVCTPFICELSRLYNQLHCTYRVLLPNLGNDQLYKRKLRSLARPYLTGTESLIHRILMSGHLIILTHIWKLDFRALFLLFGIFLLETKSLGCLYLKSMWHSSGTSISW